MPKMLIQGLGRALSSGFFLDIVISAYVVNKCIHTNYLNQEKFAQIEWLAQKQSKTVKNDEKMPKMLVQVLGGTLRAYFMVVKPPSSFSSQKMGMVGELVHSILWKVYFSEPD